MPEPVWYRFLTEQDRAHLTATGHRPIGFGEKPALLLIDLYRWVFGDEPEPLLEAVRTWPGSCGLAAWNAIPLIQTLLKAARNTGIPIVHTTRLDQSGLEGWTVWRELPEPVYASAEAAERRQRHIPPYVLTHST